MRTEQQDLLSFYNLKFNWPLSVYTCHKEFVVQTSVSHTCQFFVLHQMKYNFFYTKKISSNDYILYMTQSYSSIRIIGLQ